MSFVTMIIKYQLDTFRYFYLEFFLAIDQCKVFAKIKLVFRQLFWYLVPYFYTTSYFSLDIFWYFIPLPWYDSVRWMALIYSIIVKILMNDIPLNFSSSNSYQLTHQTFDYTEYFYTIYRISLCKIIVLDNKTEMALDRKQHQLIWQLKK